MKTSSELTDNQLVQAFKSGNAQALETLINRYKDKIFSSVLFLVKDKYVAEDLFQDTFTKIIDTIRADRYSEEGKFLPWAIRIAHNLCVDHFRKVKRKTVVQTDNEVLFDLYQKPENSVDTKMEQTEEFGKINQLLEMLPENQREVLVLRHFADLNFKEISDITNCSINTALGRMRYGLINLRKILTEKQIAL